MVGAKALITALIAALLAAGCMTDGPEAEAGDQLSLVSGDSTIEDPKHTGGSQDPDGPEVRADGADADGGDGLDGDGAGDTLEMSAGGDGTAGDDKAGDDEAGDDKAGDDEAGDDQAGDDGAGGAERASAASSPAGDATSSSSDAGATATTPPPKQARTVDAPKTTDASSPDAQAPTPPSPGAAAGASGSDQTTPTTTDRSSTAPASGGQAAPAASPSSPTAGRGSLQFSETFDQGNWQSRLDHGLFHRDDYLIIDSEWPGDHAITGPDDLCGPPTEKRTISRGDRSSGFNDDWIYRCVPGGDLGKAHIMTSIGDTSGYSIGAFAPKPTFTDVTEVRWDVNQTDLGDRQWTEIAIIPASRFDMQRLPCTLDVPCDTSTHDQLGSVGTQWAGQRARRINTPEQPGGYLEAGGDLGYRCEGCPYAPSVRFGTDYGAGDPALTSIAIRRTNSFRDNGDGTLTWGYQLDDGSFEDFTVPGRFPSGPVRVVFKDHNYTPLKSPATLVPETTFSWHWDNIEVYTG